MTIRTFTLALALAPALLAGPLAADDGREAIIVTQGERDHILQEMRGLLEAVHGILEGIMAEDYEAIAKEASAVGMVLARGENPQLVAKLPAQFKINGFAAHSAFDRLAQNAVEFRDRDMVMEELTTIVAACTACHAGYRIEAED